MRPVQYFPMEPAERHVDACVMAQETAHIVRLHKIWILTLSVGTYAPTHDPAQTDGMNILS